MEYTKEQQQVIDLRNRNLLVSAAAGSGKTAVLVERIIAEITDPEHPIDIDRLVVVTFTKAAAAEMRERIAKAIEKVLETHPGDAHLRRQSALVHNAKISTIHSFCQSIIRNYFYKVDLEPGFRVGDEREIKLLRQDVLEKLLEDLYTQGEEAFLRFVEAYGEDRSNEKLQEMLLDVYDFAMSYPWPEEYFAQCKKVYAVQTEEELLESPLLQEFVAYTRMQLEGLKELCELTIADCQRPDGPEAYESLFQQEFQMIKELLDCEGYVGMASVCDKIKFDRLPSKASKNPNFDPERKDAAKKARDTWKKELQNIQKDYALSVQELHKDMQQAAPMVDTLIDVISEFSVRFAAEKRDRGILDFSDLEHQALAILVDAKTKEPTEVAKEFQDFYEEIMVDEYQDSNYVQEAILTAVSRVHTGENNLFMVGDVKQSIYSFRMARPDLFMEKYHRYARTDAPEQCVELAKNFRSRDAVLDAVNQVFFRTMKQNVADVEYNNANALHSGGFYKTADTEQNRTEILVTDNGDTNEALMVAQRIHELVDGPNPMLIYDKQTDGVRPLRYGDISILMRSLKERGEVFAEVLKAQGISAYCQSQKGYFESLEIRMLLSFLQVVDNPHQDIPLAAVLSTPVYGFTEEDLAKLRIAQREADFATCLTSYIEQGEEADLRARCKTAWEQICSFREKSAYASVAEMLEIILRETDFESIVAAMPGGARRLANVEMLQTYAHAFQRTSFRGLFQFNRYMEDLRTYDMDFGDAQADGEGLDAVSITSIHKSKGLEYPVVFVCCCQREFYLKDLRSKVLLHAKHGVGVNAYNLESRTFRPTIARKAISILKKKEVVGEEMRVLYVAMTRAREKLILTGTTKNNEKTNGDFTFSSPEATEQELLDAKCYFDWLLPALGGCKDQVVYQYIGEDELAERALAYHREESVDLSVLETVAQSADPALTQEIDTRFAEALREKEEAVIPAKVSVSEIKARTMQQSDPEAYEMFHTQEAELYVPDFARDDATAEHVSGGARHGTMVHHVLQCLDFSEALDASDRQANVTAQIERLADAGVLSHEEVQGVTAHTFAKFLQSNLFVRMATADKAKRLIKESPFVMALPAHEVDPSLDSAEPVLVQGIMDAYFSEEESIVLMDYKTDKVNNKEELINRYRKQMELYGIALRNATGKPVKEAVLYSFSLEEEINVALLE